MNFFTCIFFQIVWLDLIILGHQMAERSSVFIWNATMAKRMYMRTGLTSSAGAKAEIQTKCMEGR